MHHKPTIIRQVYDATKQSPTLTKQEKNQNSIPMARKVGHFIIAFLSLSFIISSCTSYQHPDLEIRQFGFQLTPDQYTYLDTANTFVVLEGVRGTKHKLDSLLTWTDMLKDYDEERALIYANEAYRLATEKNFRLSRAIAMSYRALFKGRGAILGEGVDEALADARISKGLLRTSDATDWKINIYGILGHSYFKTIKTELQDSAIYYGLKALQLTENSRKNFKAKAYVRGQILLDLAIIYTFQLDSIKARDYLTQSLEAAEAAENLQLQCRIWRDLGNLYLKTGDRQYAERSYLTSIDKGILAGDEKGLIDTYQRLANFLRSKAQGVALDSLIHLSNTYLHQCLSLQKNRRTRSNLYYTYLLMGYNYNILFEQKIPESRSSLKGLADSTLKYYNLAMKEAGREGAIRIMPSTVKNISVLCSTKRDVTGEDCEELLVKSSKDYYFKFINDNYSNLVNTVTEGLANSNERIRVFEKDQAEAINNFRVNRNWSISAGGLLIAALIFLIIIQVQQQKRLQARMDALRAQINPHFMSNSLNAIENLVNRNENEAAAKYLIHFSRLSRKILSSSRNALTTLSEELKTLEHFLALEQLRFRDKLHYEISISEDLNPKSVQIPALILQPYIENAIWHGIKPKKEPSLLQIKAEKEGKSLKCIIEDDGVGRKKAQELKEQSILVKHKSQGMKITEERLQKIGKVKGSRIEIIDLYDEAGEASGTRVIIRMPLKEA